MSIHVCKCTHNGREEYHLRYPGMTEPEAQDLADTINGGGLATKRDIDDQERALDTWLKEKQEWR